MTFQDLIITPIYIVIFTLLAYFIRPYVTNKQTRKYFLPALWVRFVGAIALGLIYQFYYGFGGDTMNFYRQAGVVYEAFVTNPSVGMKLLFADGTNPDPDVFAYSSRIYWFRSSTEYIVIKIISLIDLFSLHTYTATALFFATFSFSGSWLMYKVFQERFPFASKTLAYAILFIPSCIFWGSGILKDTITLGALGLVVWGFNKIIHHRRIRPLPLIVTLLAVWLIYSIKIYILMCVIPALFFWWYLENIKSVKNKVLKILVIPVFGFVFATTGYLLLTNVAGTSEKYNLDDIAERAYITSYDIRFYSGKDAGSGYDLGVQDGTFASLIRLFPTAVNVSLFRPYLWEVSNPLMLLSAMEAFLFAILTIRLLFKMRLNRIRKIVKNPLIRMCLIFSVSFAFAVGVSTYNFGSLSRYKIPLLPFYGAVLAVSFASGRTHKHLNS